MFSVITACLLTILVASQSHAYDIEGVIHVPPGAPRDWTLHTKVQVDGGAFISYVRPDGGFKVSHLPSGSYLVEFINPQFIFPPVRIDINSKGKLRARKANPLQPNAVNSLAYPLRISSLGEARYFEQREQLRTLDLLLNPSVLIMIAPLLFFMVLPKLMNTNDPEVQREMQQMNIFNSKNNLPDLSEFLSSFGSNGGAGSSKARSSTSASHRRLPPTVGSSSSSGTVDRTPSTSSSASSNNLRKIQKKK